LYRVGWGAVSEDTFPRNAVGKNCFRYFLEQFEIDLVTDDDKKYQSTPCNACSIALLY